MKRFYFILFLLLAINENKAAAEPVNSAMLSFSRQDLIADFWSWFIKNEQRLRNFESDPDMYLSEFLAQARKIKPGLAIELESPENGVINMTISADGNVELFSLVKQVVAKAPRVKGWKIFAFRQRAPEAVVKQMAVKVGDILLEPDKMKFLPVIENGQLNIIIYAAGVNDQNYNQVAYAGLMLLDNVLGEYDCVTKVHSYDFRELREYGKTGPVPRPLLELPFFVDEFHSKK